MDDNRHAYVPLLPDIRRSAKKLADLDLREVLQVIARRRTMIAGVVLSSLLVVAGVLSLLNPSYTTESTLVFEGKVGPVVDIRAALSDQPQDEATIVSEIDIIKSRSLAKRVIEQLHLDTDPEFNPALREPTAVATYIHDARNWLARFTPSETTTVENPELQKQDVIDEFLTRVDAKLLPRSRTATVSFTAHDPKMAATVLNTLVELYLTARLEDRLANARRASDWLSTQTTEMKREVEAAEKAVESYRAEHQLYQAEGGTLLDRQIVDLTVKLNDATTARQASEAELNNARRLIASGQVESESAAEILNSPVIQRYREDELALGRKEAEMREYLGARHPQMIQLQAEKQLLQDKLKTEIRRITNRLEGDVQVARSREAAVSSDLQTLKARLAESNRASVGLQSLEQNLESRRLLLDRFMTAFTEATAQQTLGSQLPDARIVSQAPIPIAPSFPKTKLLLAAALFVSCVIAVGVAFILEHLDPGFRSAEQLEAAFGVPVMAHIPRVRGLGPHDDDLSTYPLTHPQSAFADAIRAISTGLVLGRPEAGARVILVASAIAGEGKTTIALALSRQLALGGRRVIVVDTDFHRAQLGRRLQASNRQPGLLDTLHGRAALQDAVRIDTRTGLHFLAAGGPARDRVEVSNGVIAPLLAELRRNYEFIVLDSAPVTALVDASVFSHFADATLMVVAWGRTPRSVVEYALQRVGKFGGRVCGIALSQVDVKKHSRYTFGDAGVYHRDADKYYRS